MKKLFKKFVVVFCAAFIALAQMPVFANSKLEAEPDVVKAAYIRLFPEYISWPDAFSPLQNNAVFVCVIGKSSIANNLTAGKFSFNAQAISSPEQAVGKCHILYIVESESDKAKNIVTQLEGKPILTVAHIDDFAENGGMIGFELVNNKMRYNVNTTTLAKAGLRINPQMLELAKQIIE